MQRIHCRIHQSHKRYPQMLFFFHCRLVPYLVQSSTFSVVGFRFYYWKYYQNKDELPMKEQMIGVVDNKNDHGGYNVSDLYIKPKYSSFKAEIADYPNMDIAQYEEAKTKTNKYMKTKEVKALSAKYTYHYGSTQHMFLHYAIAFGASVSFWHILSLIFYTDYSKLSTAFSSTFRKIHNFETLKSIKRRNALYYHMSKYLRELVEIFGQCSYGDRFDGDKPSDALYGPFYCGMNTKMNVDSFAKRLNSPSSTSKQLAVAVKFSGECGIVFAFDNPRNEWQYTYLRAFACSHISRFPEEDECLFFGGFYRIKVVNLRLIETNENFEKFVTAFFKFDQFLTGSYSKLTNKECFVIEHLIKLSLKKQTNVKMPAYIVDCFSSFCQNKKSLIFDLHYMDKYGNDRANKYLFPDLDKKNPREKLKRTDDDFGNLIRPSLLALFPNAQSLTTDTHYGYQYCFSLIAFLNIICEANLNEIIIKSKNFLALSS